MENEDTGIVLVTREQICPALVLVSDGGQELMPMEKCE